MEHDQLQQYWHDPSNLFQMHEDNSFHNAHNAHNLDDPMISNPFQNPYKTNSYGAYDDYVIDPSPLQLDANFQLPESNNPKLISYDDSLFVTDDKWTINDICGSIRDFKPEPKFNQAAQDILQKWEEAENFASALELHREFLQGHIEPPYVDGPLEEDCQPLVPKMLELFKYRILPYSFDVCIKEEILNDVKHKLQFKFRQKPHLCIMVLERDNPNRLIEELRRNFSIRVFASNLKGKVLAGYYDRDTDISQFQVLEDDENPTWRSNCQLSVIHEGFNAYAGIHEKEKPWLVDIWVDKWGMDVDLAKVVEQAAQTCNYPALDEQIPAITVTQSTNFSRNISAFDKLTYTCIDCDSRFDTLQLLHRHKMSSHNQLTLSAQNLNDSQLECNLPHPKTGVPCNKSFASRNIALRHKSTVHSTQRFQCSQCIRSYSRKYDLRKHERKHGL